MNPAFNPGLPNQAGFSFSRLWPALLRSPDIHVRVLIGGARSLARRGPLRERGAAALRPFRSLRSSDSERPAKG